MRATKKEEQEYYGYPASKSGFVVNEDLIMELIKLYNQSPRLIPKKYIKLVKQDLIDFARQMAIDLAFYYDGKKLFIGPKYPRDEKSFEEYGIPKFFSSPYSLAIRVADVEDQLELKKDKQNDPSNTKENALELGFLEASNNKLSNGNTEYIMYHPQYKAVIHFELKADGTFAQIYSINKQALVLVPVKYGESKTPIVSYHKFDDTILDRIKGLDITEWPEIKIGEHHYFTSTEDGRYLDEAEKFVAPERVKRFYSIRTLQKIALSKELIDLMGFNNATQIDQMSKIGLSMEAAFDASKADENNLS